MSKETSDDFQLLEGEKVLSTSRMQGAATWGKLASCWQGPREFMQTKGSAKVSLVGVRLSLVLVLVKK